MVTSEIRLVNGDPALFVNGERVLEDAYVTYFIKKARYSDFARPNADIVPTSTTVNLAPVPIIYISSPLFTTPSNTRIYTTTPR